VARLYAASGGVPRLVNILAHKALMLCYGQGKSRVERAHVLAAARDTPSVSGTRRWPWMAAGTLLASLLAAGATWALMR
jgi:MSHA biogenesis protein MshM